MVYVLHSEDCSSSWFACVCDDAKSTSTFLVLLLQICYVMIGTDIRRTTKAATTVGLRSSSSSEGFRKAEIIS